MIEIRDVKRADFPEWAKMRYDLWPSASPEQHLADILKQFGQDSFRAWLALNKGEFVGFTEASLRPFANGCKGRPVVFIEGIWVRPQLRKNGIGRRLIKAIEEWVHELGLNEIGSDVALSNLTSQGSHESWGFRETERVVYYRKDLSE